MSSLLKHIIMISILLIGIGCGRDGPLLIDTPIDEISNSLSTLIPDLMDREGIVGLSVAVIRDNEKSLSKSFGYRDIESKEEVDAHTVYKAASLGKPVFAYLVVKLAQQGKIDPDKPLYSYTGESVIENDVRSNQVTARMVLSHSTGLPNLGLKSEKKKFYFNPGEAFKYSGHGYLYLQKIVENITNKSLNELAEELVFEPLEMSRSSYRWRDGYRDDIASSYGEDKEKFSVKKEAWVGYSAWSLYTTIGDYANFVSHIMSSSKDPDSVAAQLLEPTVNVVSGVKWGLGWGLQDTVPNQSFWHWGNMAGFRHYVVGYPKEKMAIIVMSNSSKAFKMIDDVMAKAIGGSFPSYDWF
ncbi:MAG: beta-lactamase family protein [Candidatus Thiodiazotropha sp. (ex Dulcina madagascariensis)]|nr:beta-lactamase family protein [Candidatus Thiodiazotropha sp. (ex Epidulcina cf. delphinae)]MCU7924711.1 beta-lactamase family protein [Candidatus Thiodiazotropha sp. (ex Dulcina madagascariensis)]MCU7929067.1 beta-lactamase family protein [Candidatus Thiodiazotropha sp. (ex Dulcina madagascariensis)]